MNPRGGPAISRQETRDGANQNPGFAPRDGARDLVTTHDPDGRVVSINDGFSKVLGFRADDVVGTYPPFPWWPPEHRHWLGPLFTLALTDEACRFVNIHVPIELQPVEGELSVWSCYAERLDDGRTAFHIEEPAAEEVDARQRVVAMAIELGDLAQAVAGNRAESLNVSDAERRRDLLSVREGEVLDLLLRGRRVQQIGEALHISAHTARNHRRSIFQKLGVQSQVELLVELRH